MTESRSAQPDRLAAAWVAALAGTSHVPMSTAEVREFLGGLSARLTATVSRLPFQPQRAAAVGAALVDAHFVGPEALGRSLSTLHQHLRQALGPACPADVGDRLRGVEEAMTAGYVQALRARTLAEQESIRRAEIDARRRAEEALRASEIRFRAVFTEAGIGIGLADLEGRVVEANPAFASMLGYTMAEFCELNVSEFFLPEDAQGMWESYTALLRGEVEHVRAQKQYRCKGGGLVWTNLTASLIRDRQGQPQYTLAMVEDVSDRRILEERLRYQALHDPLTGLPNRTLFFDRLNAVLARPGSRAGICYLDLDGFKAINDTLGHDMGDQLLVAVAERLGSLVGESASIAARMGGDEFVVLIEQCTGTGELVTLSGQILAQLERPFLLGAHQIGITASIGIVARAAGTGTAVDMLKDADTTLYWAKSEGSGRWAVYDPERKATDTTRLTLTASIRTALERDQFTLEYQPLVDLPDGTLRGVEALLRWKHPTLGTLPPDAFIPLAETSGVIAPLGRWVLETACRQASAWQRAHPESAPYVSVNVSVRQAMEPELVEDVARILEETGLPAALLQLELTEGALVEAGGRPLDVLHKLSALGVRIAIDDFGTGYSNLVYLHRLPADALKLPGSFVGEVCPPGRPDEPGPAEEPIISALVSLAHTLGLTVTVEGVENRAQAQQLASLGCDTAQGWYFGRPVPADHITALLRATGRPSFCP
jgi:diguanylate cyclase (GGDEF)-like protein/PAS domain S-box-containing protein